MLPAKLFRDALAFALGCGLLSMGLASSANAQQCALNSPSGKIKHVVYVEFDNVHFTRDNPNVPSDLEQMPALLNFLTENGTLDTGDHAVLISHTANDILTTQTGLYSDHDGIFIANSFGDFEPGGGFVDFPSSFFYWTDLVSDINSFTKDNTFALTTPTGQNVPAPWVPFTRAGCDVGAFSTANIVLERQPFDVQKVFGAGSPQASETGANQTNDFIGAAIHCAVGSSFCTPANTAVADTLPDEPGGYSGYQALFGLKYIAPALGGLTDYNGTPITGFGQLNFNPTPAQTLAVVETMLKKASPLFLLTSRTPTTITKAPRLAPRRLLVLAKLPTSSNSLITTPLSGLSSRTSKQPESINPTLSSSSPRTRATTSSAALPAQLAAMASTCLAPTASTASVKLTTTSTQALSPLAMPLRSLTTSMTPPPLSSWELRLPTTLRSASSSKPSPD